MSAVQTHAPLPLHRRGHDPQKGSGAGGSGGVVGLPFAHVKGMCHHACAWLHLQDRGTQLQIEFRQQVKGDHGCRAEIFFENIPRDDAHFVLHTSLGHLAPGKLCHLWIEFNAHCIGLEFLCCRNGNDAVTRAQVKHPVLGGDFGHGQHFFDQLRRCGDPHHVLAVLTPHGLVVRVGDWGTGTAHQNERRQKGKNNTTRQGLHSQTPKNASTGVGSEPNFN